MKINWETGVVVGVIGFMGFVLCLLFAMNTDKVFMNDLVTYKNHKQELEYKQQIKAANNSSKLEENMKVLKTNEGFQINSPSRFSTKNIKGKVFLYRPSNKQLDFEIPISLFNTHVLVPKKMLLDGR